jgi:hypothetical protein
MAAVEVGESYTSSFVVTDVSGEFIDPIDVTLTVTLPDQTTVTPSVTKDSVGHYHVSYTFTLEGIYKFTWLATSPDTIKSDYVPVNVYRSIIGLDDAKNFVNYSTADNREDILRQIMAAATELAENTVGSCVIRTLTNVRIPGDSKPAIRLPGAPIPTESSVTSIASVYEGGPMWTQANNDFIVSPESGVVQLKGFIPFWLGPWKATYDVGRVVIPQTIQLAVQEIIYDMWSTQRPYGADELEPGPEATARFEQMIATYSVPPHAKALLDANEMPGFA